MACVRVCVKKKITNGTRHVEPHLNIHLFIILDKYSAGLCYCLHRTGVYVQLSLCSEGPLDINTEQMSRAVLSRGRPPPE